MKKFLLCAAFAAAAIFSAAAQSNVITMEEAILGKGVVLPSAAYHWTGDKDIAALGAGKKAPAAASIKAYPKGNNVYYKDLDGVEHAITSESNPDIISGQSVSRNEFGINGGVFISPDGQKIAFYQKDESRVTAFPLFDIRSRTGKIENIKYPMNGMASEHVRLGVYDIASGKTAWMKVTDFDEERYLTNISWNPASDKIWIQVLDRAQKHMHLNVYDAATGDFERTFLTEEDKRFVEPQRPLRFLQSDPDKFIYATGCRDGFWNLYLCSVSAGSVTRLTKVDADVDYMGQDDKFVYYYSYENSTVGRTFCRVNIKKGTMQNLTPAKGNHTCTISPDGKYFADYCTSLDLPQTISVYTIDGKKKVKDLLRTERGDLNPKLTNCIIECGTIKSADGKFDNPYKIMKPADFDPAKKYPVVLYVYGGPHNRVVADNYIAGFAKWALILASKGYIVFSLDNRGSGHQGAEYEKAIHRQCGKAEMEDQMEGIKWLKSHSWVDAGRIGVHGWSYGGFMTISLLVNYPETFKVAVAGGPVIDWKWYEIMYGERYMETEATNPEGFASTSLIPRAKDVKGKLLICQGAMDSTVVWEHSLSFVEACIKNNVPVDYFPYPTHPHNVSGKDRIHLMNKVIAYFDDYL